MEHHVLGCQSCAAIVREEPTDDFQAGVGEPNPEFLRRLKQLPWPPAEASLDRPADPGLFVGPSDDGPGALPAIAGFRVVREIGRGGMGVVYEAIELALGRRVALKLLAPQLSRQSTSVERFRREARAAARLHHTNIVPVFGVGEDGGAFYYVMQFIEGLGLDRIFDRSSRPGQGQQPSLLVPPLSRSARGEGADGSSEIVTDLSGDPTEGPKFAGPPTTSEGRQSPPASGSSDRSHFRTVAQIGWKVAEALAFAHGQGILHRDVKPANILIDVQGSAWVADFGLAKAAEGEDGLTLSGDIVGTLRYMSPERIEGRSEVRGDVYALGVTLYEPLTFRPLFGEGNRARLIQKILQEAPPRPRALDRSIPRDLETIVLKAIAKEPSARYATAAAMAEDLRRYRAGEPILARRAGLGEQLWRWSRRNPQVASLLAALAMVLAGGFSAMAVLWAKAEAGADAARSSARLADLHAQSEARTRAASVLQSVRLELDTGALWGRQGRIGRGLLWIDHGMQTAPPEAVDLRRAGLADFWAWATAVVPSATLRHAKNLYEIHLAPDGRTLVVGSGDQLHLWDLETRTRTWAVDARGQGIMASITADGRRIVVTSEYTGVRLLDAASGAVLRQLTPMEKYHKIVGLTPDGQAVLVSSTLDGEASMISLVDGHSVGKRMDHGGPAEYALSPDGMRAYSSGHDGKLRAWDMATGELVGQPLEVGHETFPFFTPAGDEFLVQAWSVDGAGGLGAPTLRVYESATASLRLEIPLRSPIIDLVFRPDGRSVLVCEQSGSARLLELATGREVGATIRAESLIGGNAYKNLSTLAAFSPDGQVVATAHVDNTVRIWEVISGRSIGPVLELGALPSGLLFRPDGRTLATAGSDGVVRVWDIVPAFPEYNLPMRVDDTVVDLSPDGRTLATYHDGVVQLVDRETGLPTAPPMIHDKPIQGRGLPPFLDLPRVRVVRFSPDGRTLATAGDDAVVRLWDVATGKSKGTLYHEHWVLALAFSPDGKALATGRVKNYARIWDVATGKPLSPILRHPSKFPSNEIHWVGFRQDGRVLVSIGNYDSVRFWDVRDGSPIDREAELPTMIDRQYSISPDGSTLLLRSDRATHVMDLRNNRAAGTGFGDDNGGLVFSPDSRRLISLGETSAQVWDVASRAPVGAPMPHPGSPIAAAFSPDGSMVATGTGDGLVRRWDAVTGRPIGPPWDHRRPVHRLLVAPDGRSLVVIGGGGATTWSVDEPIADDPARLAMIAARTSSLALNDRGEMRPLSVADQERLNEPGPPLADRAGSIGLHDRLAAYYANDGRHAAALWHLDRLIALRPGIWSDFARRSVAHRGLGQHREAEANEAKAAELAPPTASGPGRPPWTWPGSAPTSGPADGPGRSRHWVGSWRACQPTSRSAAAGSISYGPWGGSGKPRRTPGSSSRQGSLR